MKGAWQTFHGVGGLFHETFAYLGRAGEGELPYAPILHDRGGYVSGVRAADYGEGAFWQVGFLEDAG